MIALSVYKPSYQRSGQSNQAARNDPEKEDNDMSVVPEHQNLCITCEKAPACTFIKDPKRSVFVLGCEDFKAYSNPSRRNSPANIPWLPAARAISLAMEKDTVDYMGLCRNCENRSRCTFPKPEGGVWECEEYQ